VTSASAPWRDLKDWRAFPHSKTMTNRSAYALILLCSILVRGAYLGDPAPDYDEQLYQFIGARMLQGDVPFVDLWDRKPVGLFLLYAFANLFGPGVLPYQIMAVVFAAAGGAMIYRIGIRFAGKFASLVAGCLYILALSAFGAAIGQSEVFYMPLAIGMAALTIKSFEHDDVSKIIRMSILAMLLGGIMLQIKYSVAPQCAFFGIVLLWRLRSLEVLTVKVIGLGILFAGIGMTPTLLVAGAYLYMGHFDAFFFSNFTSILSRGALSGPYEVMFRTRVLFMATPLVIVAAVGMIKYHDHNQRAHQHGYLLIIGWTLSAAISFLIMGNIYLHYFIPLLPGLLLLATPMLGMDLGGMIIVPLLSLFFTVVSGVAFSHEASEQDRASLSLLTEKARPYVGKMHSCMYIFDGPTALYRTTDSCLLTRYVYPDHLSNEMEANAIGIDPNYEVQNILKNRPSVLVTASTPIVPKYNAVTAKLVDDAVGKSYTRVAEAYYFHRFIYINVRNDLIDAKAQPTLR
jgi:hypothetical protein